MNLFSESPSNLARVLTEVYRPRKVADFIGNAKPKLRMQTLISRPKESSWLFVGDSGIGKTTLALAVAEELQAELHHIPSQRCDIAAVEAVRRRCQNIPMLGPKGMHLVLVDEADTMSRPAQDAFLSILDSTNRAPNTIFIFTCNSIESLHVRFRSRCFAVDFSVHGFAKETASFLERLWNAETGNRANPPNFARIVKDANNNIRTAILELEMEIDAALAS